MVFCLVYPRVMVWGVVIVLKYLYLMSCDVTGEVDIVMRRPFFETSLCLCDEEFGLG